MGERVIEIGEAHRAKVEGGIGDADAGVQCGGKVLEGAPDHFREDMIAAGEMLVGRLMRNPEPARDLAQAQLVQSALGDDGQRFHDAGFAQVRLRCAHGAMSTETRATPSAPTANAASAKVGARNIGRTWLETPQGCFGRPSRSRSTPFSPGGSLATATA